MEALARSSLAAIDASWQAGVWCRGFLVREVPVAEAGTRERIRALVLRQICGDQASSECAATFAEAFVTDEASRVLVAQKDGSYVAGLAMKTIGHGKQPVGIFLTFIGSDPPGSGAGSVLVDQLKAYVRAPHSPLRFIALHSLTGVYKGGGRGKTVVNERELKTFSFWTSSQGFAEVDSGGHSRLGLMYASWAVRGDMNAYRNGYEFFKDCSVPPPPQGLAALVWTTKSEEDQIPS